MHMHYEDFDITWAGKTSHVAFRRLNRTGRSDAEHHLNPYHLN